MKDSKFNLTKLADPTTVDELYNQSNRLIDTYLNRDEANIIPSQADEFVQVNVHLPLENDKHLFLAGLRYAQKDYPEQIDLAKEIKTETNLSSILLPIHIVEAEFNVYDYEEEVYLGYESEIVKSFIKVLPSTTYKIGPLKFNKILPARAVHEVLTKGDIRYTGQGIPIRMLRAKNLMAQMESAINEENSFIEDEY